MKYTTKEGWNFIKIIQSSGISARRNALYTLIRRFTNCEEAEKFSVLDLACGTSKLALESLEIINENSASPVEINYLGIDLDNQILDFVRPAKTINSKWNIGSVHELDFKNIKPDLILCLDNSFLSLGDLNQLNSLLEGISMSLSKETTIILSVLPWDILRKNYYFNFNKSKDVIPDYLPRVEFKINTTEKFPDIVQKIDFRYSDSTSPEVNVVHRFKAIDHENVELMVKKNNLDILGWFHSHNATQVDPLKSDFPEFYLVLKTR